MRPGGSGTSRVERQCGDRLAAAGFTHQAQSLAIAELEADVVNSVYDAVRREEMRRQVANLEQVLRLGALNFALGGLCR